MHFFNIISLVSQRPGSCHAWLSLHARNTARGVARTSVAVLAEGSEEASTRSAQHSGDMNPGDRDPLFGS